MISKGSSRYFGALVLVLLLFGAGPGRAEVAASVVFASGAAAIVAADGVSRRAERGGEVQAGEMIDTADGKVQLRFRDGASMSLQPDTHFRVDQFRFAEQGGQAAPESRGFFSLLKGGFRTVTGLIGKRDNRQYRVETAVATIGIRGTFYSAGYRPLPGGALNGLGRLEVATTEGMVEVCNQAGCALVREGQAAVVTSPTIRPEVGFSQGGAPGSPPDVGAPKLPEALPQAPPQPISQDPPSPAGGTMMRSKGL